MEKVKGEKGKSIFKTSPGSALVDFDYTESDFVCT